MARNAATACSTLLLIAAATTLLVPAASAAKLVAGKDAATATATAAALGSITVAPWVEDDAGGVGGMMMVVAAAGSVEYGHGGVHRRVLQARGGRNVNPSLVADRQRCIGSCPARGGSYTGRGNQCYYHNRSC
uniref:Uncharacterized protein n=1 Tax=Oryza meridionalis TaxID=40149 RepID=A0A0E0FC33_9ORYZ